MRTTTFTRLFTLTAGLATVASLALGTSTAAQAGTLAAAGGASSAVKSTDVGSGAPTLTAEAKAAGKKAHGAKATTTEILEAYWTKDRMAAAISADQDPALASSATAYVEKTTRDLKAGKKPATNDDTFRPRSAALAHRRNPR